MATLGVGKVSVWGEGARGGIEEVVAMLDEFWAVVLDVHGRWVVKVRVRIVVGLGESARGEAAGIYGGLEELGEVPVGM